VVFGLEFRKLVYKEWWILKGEMGNGEWGMGNGEWGILRNWGTSEGPPISQNSPAKFQISPANSPSVNLSSANENARGIGNGKRVLTQSKLTTPILRCKMKN